MTVKELQDRMDSREISEWMAFDRRHISDSWYQNALLCSVVANTVPRGKGVKPFTVEYFLPKRRKAFDPKAALNRFLAVSVPEKK